MDIEIIFEGNKRISAKVNDQIIKTDQPVTDGGEGTAASPFDLFMASMGTCVGYYVKAFCDNRKISTSEIKIVQHSDYNKESHLVENINIEIQLPDNFPEEHKEHLLRAAGKCKVKKHLETPPKVIVEYKK